MPAGRGAAPAAPVVPCTCRLSGRDIQIGRTACIRGRVARCERVLNNTSWSIGETPCPVSAAPAPAPQ